MTPEPADIDAVWHILQPARLTAVVDVGANPIDGDPPYKPLLGKELCTVVGFEPQADALESLNLRKGRLESYLPYAVGDGLEHTLYHCQVPGMTSLLKPNDPTLSCFNLFSDFGRVLNSEVVQTRRLDEIGEIRSLDFLKIDIQGAELSVFRSGRNKLREAVAIQTEVSFVPLYENQPVFGDVDLELRSQGFIPHAFPAVKRWPIRPFVANHEPRYGLNQLLEADVVYVRDFTRPKLFTTEQLKHLALIAHHCYTSYDLALRCMLILVSRGILSREIVDGYYRMVSQGAL